MAITKTDFMRGMQCPKMLWLDRHKPGERVIPPEVRARLDAGSEFGRLARGMFGPYEEMTVLRPGTAYPDKAAMLARTREHLDAGTAVLCEAAFSDYNNYCAVDILRRTETGYDIYEVKDAPELHPPFVRDAGFQYYILTRCKVKVGRIFVVLHGPDEDDPFVCEDVTREARGCYRWVNDHIWELNRMQYKPEAPETAPGDRCSDPYECWYYGYCHRDQLRRIERFETLLRRLQEAVAREDVTPAELADLEETARALAAYYGSDEWKRDLAEDEAGRLPRELRRGVLSEDGIYNALETFRERREAPGSDSAPENG